MPLLPLDVLRTGASELGIELSDQQIEQFDAFATLLLETNRRFNLTRIVDPEQIVTNHLLDSLLCLWAVELAQGARLIDVGTGAGFPGLPIKIARPDVVLTLLDGTAKKVGFVRDVVERLGLDAVEPLYGRAEEIGHDKTRRERYDIACARALSDLGTVAELCVPFVRTGGRAIACKGPEVDQELAAARPMIGKLGGEVEKIVRTHIPGTDVARTMVVIVKTKQTPCEFPRHYSRIAKGRTNRVN